MMPLLEVKHLAFGYGRGREPVLKDISFQLEPGEILAIIGPSGSGKSTLLRSLALLNQPSAGEIRFKGQVVQSAAHPSATTLLNYRRAVGMVFQELYLWPHLTVLENITLPLIRGKGESASVAQAKAELLLDRLSLSPCARQYPLRMSVGQQQRCALARALALDPDLLLLDEVTSALDPELVGSILELIRHIAAETAKTMVVVTHEMEFASRIATRVAFLDKGCFLIAGTIAEVCERAQESHVHRFLAELAQEAAGMPHRPSS